jgi:hypothetical protein
LLPVHCCYCGNHDSYLKLTAFIIFNQSEVDIGTLIYYDEISSGSHSSFVDQYRPRTGALYCGSYVSNRIRWHYPNGDLINEHRVYTLLTDDHVVPYWARVHRNYDDDNVPRVNSDGLWTCREDGNIAGAAHVGVYQRGRML